MAPYCPPSSTEIVGLGSLILLSLSLLVLALGVPSLSHSSQLPSISKWLPLTTEDLMQNCFSSLLSL